MTERERSLFEKAADGCHRYGWLLAIVLNALMLAYFVGGQSQSLQDIKERVGRMEQQWDQYLREIRGIETK